MEKFTMVNKQHWTQNIFLATVVITALSSFNSYSCGGGVVPYVPTQTGASGSSSGQFFILEKGVAVNMFDVKKFQPLFRNIILSGNERKKRKHVKEKLEKTQRTTGQTDSEKAMQKDSSSITPVLNVHRLH